MAVVVIDNPTERPEVISVSHDQIITVQTNIYGTAGVTQFRFVCEFTSIYDLGTKYTVVSQQTLKRGTFNISEVIKTTIPLSEKADSGEDITEITSPKELLYGAYEAISTPLKEQYYLNGVYTENVGVTLLFDCCRGYSDEPDWTFKYANWYQFNGLEKFFPYTGQTPQVYPTRNRDDLWPTYAAGAYMNIDLTAEPGSVPVASYWFDRQASTHRVFYFPIYHSGDTDGEDFERLTVKITISDTNGGGGTDVLVEEYDIYRTTKYCEDPEVLVMFQDRFFQWSFMSFTKKHYVTTNTEPQQSENVDGRYRYNVEGSDIITLHTDHMVEDQNDLFKDLVQTEKCYIVDPDDGTLEQITVVPNSLSYRTSRNDGVFQYSMRFRLSKNNFRP